MVWVAFLCGAVLGIVVTFFVLGAALMLRDLPVRRRRSL